MGSLPALVPVWACQQFLAFPPWALLLVQALLVDGIQMSWIPHLCGFPCPHSCGQLWSCCWIRAGRSQKKTTVKQIANLKSQVVPVSDWQSVLLHCHFWFHLWAHLRQWKKTQVMQTGTTVSKLALLALLGASP